MQAQNTVEKPQPCEWGADLIGLSSGDGFRRFARRQRTWHRSVPEALWLDPGQGDPIAKNVESFLSGSLEPARTTAAPCS